MEFIEEFIEGSQRSNYFVKLWTTAFRSHYGRRFTANVAVTLAAGEAYNVNSSGPSAVD